MLAILVESTRLSSVTLQESEERIQGPESCPQGIFERLLDVAKVVLLAGDGVFQLVDQGIEPMGLLLEAAEDRLLLGRAAAAGGRGGARESLIAPAVPATARQLRRKRMRIQGSSGVKPSRPRAASAARRMCRSRAGRSASGPAKAPSPIAWRSRCPKVVGVRQLAGAVLDRRVQGG